MENRLRLLGDGWAETGQQKLLLVSILCFKVARRDFKIYLRLVSVCDLGGCLSVSSTFLLANFD